MPTPTKPYKVIEGEKKSHRTKAELAARRRGEEQLKTSAKLKERKEVRAIPDAHKEFLRLNKILGEIDKNDAVYEAVINRYCVIQAECKELEERKAVYWDLLDKFKELLKDIKKPERESYVLELVEITGNIVKLAGQMAACDKILSTKRKMLLDIEKENIMTIAAALRTIPKKAEKEANPLLKALQG